MLLFSEVRMNTPKIDALAERIERMERQNRLWKWGAGFTVIGGLVAMIGGAQRANEAQLIDAETINVCENDSHERAQLGVGLSGVAYWSLKDKSGDGGIDLVASLEGHSHVDVWSKTQGHLMLVAAPDRMAVDFLDKNRVGQIALKIEKGDGTQYRMARG
jgi:hypothetical protein